MNNTNSSQSLLFIDRDGTLILEPTDEQIDSFEKLKFYPGAIYWLSKIARELDYKLIMVTNQDGLGTSVYPENTFWPVQNFIIQTLQNEGVHFDEISSIKPSLKTMLLLANHKQAYLPSFLIRRNMI